MPRDLAPTAKILWLLSFLPEVPSDICAHALALPEAQVLAMRRQLRARAPGGAAWGGAVPSAAVPSAAVPSAAVPGGAVWGGAASLASPAHVLALFRPLKLTARQKLLLLALWIFAPTASPLPLADGSGLSIHMPVQILARRLRLSQASVRAGLAALAGHGLIRPEPDSELITVYNAGGGKSAGQNIAREQGQGPGDGGKSAAMSQAPEQHLAANGGGQGAKAAAGGNEASGAATGASTGANGGDYGARAAIGRNELSEAATGARKGDNGGNSGAGGAIAGNEASGARKRANGGDSGAGARKQLRLQAGRPGQAWLPALHNCGEHYSGSLVARTPAGFKSLAPYGARETADGVRYYAIPARELAPGEMARRREADPDHHAGNLSIIILPWLQAQLEAVKRKELTDLGGNLHDQAGYYLRLANAQRIDPASAINAIFDNVQTALSPQEKIARRHKKSGFRPDPPQLPLLAGESGGAPQNRTEPQDLASWRAAAGQPGGEMEAAREAGHSQARSWPAGGQCPCQPAAQGGAPVNRGAGQAGPQGGPGAARWQGRNQYAGAMAAEWPEIAPEEIARIRAMNRQLAPTSYAVVHGLPLPRPVKTGINRFEQWLAHKRAARRVQAAGQGAA